MSFKVVLEAFKFFSAKFFLFFKEGNPRSEIKKSFFLSRHFVGGLIFYVVVRRIDYPMVKPFRKMADCDVL